MKGDFSRIRLSKKQEREKNYRKVLFQQGRVVTDSDLNAYVEMVDQQNLKSLGDIIGKSGVPLEQKESFEIEPIEGTNRYTIGKGRMYVDGILVENFITVQGFSDETGNIAEQPYLPSLFVDGQQVSDAVPKEEGIYLAYLVVYDRHITALNDSDLQDSALRDSDTSTCIQTVWQVKLHKIQDDDISNDPNEENNWAPWIDLENDTGDEFVVNDIRIGRNNDGSLLEVFALSNEGERFRRKSRRQERLNPVEWEGSWIFFPGNDIKEFDIASRHEDGVEILHTFLRDRQGLHYFIRNTIDDRRDKEDAKPNELPGDLPNNLKLVMNPIGNLEAFVIQSNIIHHSKKRASEPWDDWLEIGEENNIFNMFSVILPKDGRIEIYAITGQQDSIWYTKQDATDSSVWSNWEKINPERQQGDPSSFDQCFVGLNQFNEVVIFAKEGVQERVWNTKRTDLHPLGNGWRVVGDNHPGRLILGRNCLSVQNNPKKQNRLEVFGIFSDDQNNNQSGKIWNIFEDKNGEWNLKWKIINEQLKVTTVNSTIDANSRVNLFAIERKFGEIESSIVHHSYIEDTEVVLNCKMRIPSWESKIEHSKIQLKTRTRPQSALPNDPCLLPEQAGYRRLENQLYRIEIHDPPKSENKNATFKFSRDNGTVCSKILNISDGKITVSSIGRDKILRFSSDQWIEITDDLHTLWGIPGILAHIYDIHGNDLIIDSTMPQNEKIYNDSFPQRFNPIARRWDSVGSLNVENPTENNGWIEIEDGIEVKFNNIDDINNCKTGDYWTTAARTSKADIEWPKGPDGLPKFVDIEGIEYHYAKLALLEFREGELTLISDCRDFFPPLNTLDEFVAPTETKSVTSWIHGTISEVEFPERLVPQELPHGPGIKNATGSTYRQQFSSLHNFNFNWFHFPIPISYPIDPERTISLQEIYVPFDSANNAKIIQIDIYDGGFIKKQIESLNLSGQHDRWRDESNTFRLDEKIVINQGIGVSIKVSFDEHNLPGIIDFRSIGVLLGIRNETCGACFTTVLSQKQLNDLIRQITEDGGPTSLQALCDYLVLFHTNEELREFWSAYLFSNGPSLGISKDQINEILDCQEELFGVDFPRVINDGRLRSRPMNWKSNR